MTSGSRAQPLLGAVLSPSGFAYLRPAEMGKAARWKGGAAVQQEHQSQTSPPFGVHCEEVGVLRAQTAFRIRTRRFGILTLLGWHLLAGAVLCRILTHGCHH